MRGETGSILIGAWLCRVRMHRPVHKRLRFSGASRYQDALVYVTRRSRLGGGTASMIPVAKSRREPEPERKPTNNVKSFVAKRQPSSKNRLDTTPLGLQNCPRQTARRLMQTHHSRNVTYLPHYHFSADFSDRVNLNREHPAIPKPQQSTPGPTHGSRISSALTQYGTGSFPEKIHGLELRSIRP